MKKIEKLTQEQFEIIDGNSNNSIARLVEYSSVFREKINEIVDFCNQQWTLNEEVVWALEDIDKNMNLLIPTQD